MNRYPREDELKKIIEWPHSDPKGLMDFIESIWEFADWGWSHKGKKYYISTGGWSGNEDIISAMKQNWMFWNLYWEESKRGGHYIFHIR